MSMLSIVASAEVNYRRHPCRYVPPALDPLAVGTSFGAEHGRARACEGWLNFYDGHGRVPNEWRCDACNRPDEELNKEEAAQFKVAQARRQADSAAEAARQRQYQTAAVPPGWTINQRRDPLTGIPQGYGVAVNHDKASASIAFTADGLDLKAAADQLLAGVREHVAVRANGLAEVKHYRALVVAFVEAAGVVQTCEKKLEQARAGRAEAITRAKNPLTAASLADAQEAEAANEVLSARATQQGLTADLHKARGEALKAVQDVAARLVTAERQRLEALRAAAVTALAKAAAEHLDVLAATVAAQQTLGEPMNGRLVAATLTELRQEL